VDHPQLNAAETHAAASVAELVRADYDALRQGAGVRAVPGRIVVRMAGDDRVSFLHGMCSNDVKNAAPGTVVPALILTEHAHLIADFFAWIAEDSILIEIDAARWAPARAHLERLLVADDVEFEDAPALAVIDIEGPRAADAVRALAGEAATTLNQWRYLRAGELLIGNVPRLGTPAFAVIGPAARLAEMLAKVAALGPNFRAIGEQAVEIVRIENGIARAGVDTNDKTIALEARLDRSISFTKGCYVGQETIERATARGGLKRRLFGIRFEGGIPSLGAALRLDGKEVGRVTSAALSPRTGAIGLAILHQAAWTVGARVQIDGAGSGTVSELPFG
jgi:folate-binding protein YgfZ